MLTSRWTAIALAGAVLLFGQADAQIEDVHGRHGFPHGDHADGVAAVAQGQAAFGVIQQAVAELEADPTTNWRRVNVEALRQHLIDMDNVVLRAQVRAEDIPGGARFTIMGVGDVVASIQRMTSGHAATMSALDAWRYNVRLTGDGAVLEVRAEDEAGGVRIRALGFIGILARGDHHQPHHFAIVSGRPAH